MSHPQTDRFNEIRLEALDEQRAELAKIDDQRRQALATAQVGHLAILAPLVALNLSLADCLKDMRSRDLRYEYELLGLTD